MAIKFEILYETVKNRANDMGMKVNDQKTQMLCICPVSEKNTATHIQLEDGNVIRVERKAFFF